MDEATRIQKDLDMFSDNAKQLDTKSLSKRHQKIVELATQYFSDAQYYLEKKDFFTSFGCINYAHGLLDAVLKDV